jgi:hypothetical protein
MSRTIKKNDNFCYKCGKPYWNDGRTTGIGLCQCDKTVKDDDSIDDLLDKLDEYYLDSIYKDNKDPKENFMKHKITFENSKIKITFENSKIKATFEYPAEYSAKEVADPLDTGAGIAEPEGGGYERVICNSWDEAASRATANTADVVFPEATGDWGTITHVVLFSHIMFVMGFQRESIEMYLTDKNEKDNYTDSFKDEYSMTIKIYPKTP